MLSSFLRHDNAKNATWTSFEIWRFVILLHDVHVSDGVTERLESKSTSVLRLACVVLLRTQQARIPRIFA